MRILKFFQSKKVRYLSDAEFDADFESGNDFSKFLIFGHQIQEKPKKRVKMLAKTVSFNPPPPLDFRYLVVIMKV